jgi:hypothetical protein
MTNTLVIDYDGVYDARLLNDRLLLGLKGTMSEFELGLLRQRAQEALRQKIARGEVLHVAPAGYERTEDNRLEMTPDLQIQQAIREVFARFCETGSARQVLLACRQEGVRLPSRDPRGRLVWQVPVFGRVIKFLKNPAYAGAYVYGRTMQRITIEDGRQQRSGGHRREAKDWLVVIRDHHAGYITWADYESNQRTLLENSTMHGKMRTAVKRGGALLSGLLRCGHCGRALQISYSGTNGAIPRYHCKGAMINHGGAWCISIGATKLDEAVGRQVVLALQPAGVEASLEAERLSAEQRRRQHEAIRLALEKARYEADRFRRQYEAVEPENRLVAAELERRWNAALQEVARLTESLQAQHAAEAGLAAEELTRLRALGTDVAAAWEHPAAPLELKKRILRTVLEEIVIRIDPAEAVAQPPVVTLAMSVAAVNAPIEDHTTRPHLPGGKSIVTLTLHWAGGAHTSTRLLKPSRHYNHPHATPDDTIALIRKLAPVCPDDQIAAILHRNGLRTGKGLTWKSHNVADARRKHEIPPYQAGSRTWLTMDQAAEALSMSAETVRRLIERRVLPAEQIVPHAPWLIAPESLRLPQIITAAETLKKTGRCGLPRVVATANLELPLI